MRRAGSVLVKVLVILLLVIAIFGTGGYFVYELFLKSEIELREHQRIQATLPPPTPPPDISLPDFAKVVALVQSSKGKDAPAAVSALESFLEHYPNSTKAAEAKKMLGDINVDRFFSAGPAPDKVLYVIKSGDAIAKIERKLKTTAELIMRTNNLLDPGRLRIGVQLWVPQPDFVIKIDRQLNNVTLFNHGHFFKEYEPTSWKAPVPTKGLAKVPIKSRVVEKMAWKNGTRVAFGTKEYAGALHWISIATPGFTIFADDHDPDPKAQRPNGGIGLAPDQAEELSVLVNRNTPVLIE